MYDMISTYVYVQLHKHKVGSRDLAPRKKEITIEEQAKPKERKQK